MQKTWRKALAWMVVVTAFASAAANAAPRPNIVLCMGDDHGWDETGYNGHPYLRTPVLDEMASSGLRLERFYAAAPSCSPTRGSVITGRHPNRYGTFAPNWSIRPEEISVAQRLGDAGYVCGHFGKWHLGAVKAQSPVNPGAMGFDGWLSHDNFFEMDPVLSANGGPPQTFSGESSQILVERAIQFIRNARRREQPFFAVIWFGSPHEPYRGLAQDLALYRDVPRRHADRRVTVTDLETGRPVQRPFGEVLQERFAEITAMDRALGQLRGALDDLGLRRDTLLWYCGDNGVPSSGRVATPLRGQKGMVYEGGVRVPGIIEWPAAIPQPRATAVNAVTSDILPTLCELAGAPLPSRPLDGISLRRCFDGTMRQRPHPVCFWNFDSRRLAQRGERPYLDPALQEGTTPLVKQLAGRFTRNFRNFHYPSVRHEDLRGPRAILDNRFKLVIHDQPDGTAVKELFDLRADPAESHNVLDEEPERAELLEQQLRDWQLGVLRSLTGADYDAK